MEWLFLFSFVMAVLTNSLMILIMFFLRKTKFFANLYSVGLMVLLYLFCVLRAALPVVLPQTPVIIRDTVVYPVVVDFLMRRSPESKILPFSIAYILIGLWILVSLILSIRLVIKQKSFRRRIDQSENLATEEEKSLLKKVSLEIFKKEPNIVLKKTRAVNESMVIGFIRPIILIPDIEYTGTELEMIIRHECMHIKNKDVWIKLLIEIYCVIFWWNPFSYLMRVDVGDTLETKCDLNVIRRFDDVDKLAYAETVVKFMSDEKDRSVPFVNARFSKSRNGKEAIKRISAILDAPPDKTKQIVLNILVIVLFAAVFFGSYLVIIQPYFGHPEEKRYELNDNAVIADDSNSYLVKYSDGTYYFYYSDYPPEKVPKEDIESGMYREYPIYESSSLPQEYTQESTKHSGELDPSEMYLIRQENGNYYLYLRGNFVEEVPKESVERGEFRGYPIYESQQEFENAAK